MKPTPPPERARASLSRSARVRWVQIVAAITSLVLVATACSADAGTHPGGTGKVDAGAMEAVANGLSDDATTAAEQLVADILSDDGQRSVAATAELLRRSGHPIVSAAGPVVAMPDEVSLLDSPIYAELIPDLAEATRAGDRYSLEQFATLLTTTGLTEQDATPAQLASSIGGWAKGPDDHPIFTTAAAGVRALSAHRQQVLFSGVQPEDVYLDPVQTILLLGHATSRFAEVAEGPSPQASGPNLVDWMLGTTVAHAAPAGPCGELASLFKSPKDPALKATDDFLNGKYKERLAQELLTQGGKEAFDKAGEAWGKAGAVASAIMLLLASRLELSADKTSTHFKHVAGSRDEHVKLTARAVFDPKVALDKLECYALAGLKVPGPGPMKGMTVRWSSEQPLAGGLQEGGNQLLKAVSADSRKTTRGSKTGADGVATLEVMPPVEDPAGEGEKLRGKALFIASLDKEDFPFEFGDFFSLLNAVGFGVGKTFDLIKEVLVKAGLPSQTITIEVEYHGADIIVAQGENEVNLILAKIPRVYVDLVSCTGTAGPFIGQAGYSGVDSSGMLQAAGSVTGVPVPANFAGKDNPISVLTNDRKGPNPFFIQSGEGGAQFLDGVLTFYPFLSTRYEFLADKRLGRPVGEVEILLGGSSYPFSDLSWLMVRVGEDPRCPEVTYEYDRL